MNNSIFIKRQLKKSLYKTDFYRKIKTSQLKNVAKQLNININDIPINSTQKSRIFKRLKRKI